MKSATDHTEISKVVRLISIEFSLRIFFHRARLIINNILYYTTRDMGKLIWIWNQHMAEHVCVMFLFVSENMTAVHVCVHVRMYVCM